MRLRRKSAGVTHIAITGDGYDLHFYSTVAESEAIIEEIKRWWNDEIVSRAPGISAKRVAGSQRMN